MTTSLCIHGHFYQPPREDPWLGSILAEPSAAPMRNWNERILRESYAPLAWARRLDSEGQIADILNCYEWMSFNAGPTLLHWMREKAPATLARMREGDAHGKARWGYGNALAQIYHHVIMPLASDEDKKLEIRWAIDDFRFHFQREPEGMWLSECAVDIATLEALATHGIQFVILAPRQAKAIRVDGKSVPVDQTGLDIGEPYAVALPSGKRITAVFYHGNLSQSIAFEGLLRNGEVFWQRIVQEARAQAASGKDNPLLTIATDGETYGHHFTFGEMALAYALAQGYTSRDDIRLTNLAAYIASRPPVSEVEIHEPSSWSCVHGIERWRSDCGCTDGGHPGWNQRWRGPLRDALNRMREAVSGHFAHEGAACFTDPKAALLAYGEVLADPGKSAGFAEAWFTGGEKNHDKAWKLLAMQEQALAAFASCAWFFDDIARIEPENAMTFALRALLLLEQTGGGNLRDTLAAELEKAQSNQPEYGSGKKVFEQEVLPRMDDPATFCLLAWTLHTAKGEAPLPGRPVHMQWPNISVELLPADRAENGIQEGSTVIRIRHERHGTRFSWRVEMPSLLREPDQRFIPLIDTAMHVRYESGEKAGTTICRRVSELSRPMRDSLLSKYLENWEQMRRPELQALASHAASMTDVWLEAQHDVIRPDFWVGFIPYLVLESMYGDHLTDRQRQQVETILSLHLSDRAKQLAKNLVEQAFRASLDKAEQKDAPAGQPAPPDDATLATWVQRVKTVLPDMDWWSVQNKLWETGLAKFPALAKALGFRR